MHNVIYICRIYFLDCNECYMGQTVRSLKSLTKGHLGNLQQPSSKGNSILTEHFYVNNRNIDWVDVKIQDEDDKHFSKFNETNVTHQMKSNK